MVYFLDLRPSPLLPIRPTNFLTKMKDVTEIELVLFNFGRRTDARKK